MSTDRAEYVAGLRALADLIEQKPELPLPVTDEFSWYLFGSIGLPISEQKSEAARIVRLIGGRHDKVETEDLYRFKSRIHGIGTQVIVDRPAVCERVVVAAEVVTKMVPDPTAPLVEVRETVEHVEWRCGSLFTDREQEMAEAANDGHLDNYDPAIDAPGADDYLADVTA
jgi:hypothetical protein